MNTSIEIEENWELMVDDLFCAPEVVREKMADSMLMKFAAKAMGEKLAVARKKGRGGWWREDLCDINELRELLADHIEKGDMRDVMNLAAMIYVREAAAGKYSEMNQ